MNIVEEMLKIRLFHLKKFSGLPALAITGCLFAGAQLTGYLLYSRGLKGIIEKKIDSTIDSIIDSQTKPTNISFSLTPLLMFIQKNNNPFKWILLLLMLMMYISIKIFGLQDVLLYLFLGVKFIYKNFPYLSLLIFILYTLYYTVTVIMLILFSNTKISLPDNDKIPSFLLNWLKEIKEFNDPTLRPIIIRFYLFHIKLYGILSIITAILIYLLIFIILPMA